MTTVLLLASTAIHLYAAAVIRRQARRLRIARALIGMQQRRIVSLERFGNHGRTRGRHQ